ncbi:hypothetical protein AAGT00_01355 [Streptomyces cavourensis]
MPQAAAERQLREPEEHFADGRQALEELRAKAAAQQRVRPSDVSRARALQRLAAKRAGLATITPAAGPYGVNRTSGPPWRAPGDPARHIRTPDYASTSRLASVATTRSPRSPFAGCTTRIKPTSCSRI